MIEPTDEMLIAWRDAMKAAAADAVKIGEPLGHSQEIARAGLAAVLAIVERDYDVRRRTSHGWPARVWPLNRGALHPHYCVTCSDGDSMGPGCINCRQTGFDQTPWPQCKECKPRSSDEHHYDVPCGDRPDCRISEHHEGGVL